MTRTILVVDNDSSLCRIMEFNLHQAGYQVTVAGDGAEGFIRLNAIARKCSNNVRNGWI
ncbi:MAG: hypothetical protein JXQ81_01580 [Desulfuromonadales bacterium]|nr:hypothetical protein [Desulfuromonadales bacterium]MBN2791176.1 hypothetical protein [Desulfuromonadales bacterium]